MRGQSERHPAADSPNVYAALADLARRSSDAALATAAAVGVLAVLGLLFARSGWGVYLLPLVAVGAFGAWGIAERDRASAPEHGAAGDRKRRTLGVVQGIAIAVGTIAAATVALALLGVLFGTVIS